MVQQGPDAAETGKAGHMKQKLMKKEQTKQEHMTQEQKKQVPKKKQEKQEQIKQEKMAQERMKHSTQFFDSTGTTAQEHQEHMNIRKYRNSANTGTI